MLERSEKTNEWDDEEEKAAEYDATNDAGCYNASRIGIDANWYENDRYELNKKGSLDEMNHCLWNRSIKDLLSGISWDLLTVFGHSKIQKTFPIVLFLIYLKLENKIEL